MRCSKVSRAITQRKHRRSSVCRGSLAGVGTELNNLGGTRGSGVYLVSYSAGKAAAQGDSSLRATFVGDNGSSVAGFRDPFADDGMYVGAIEATGTASDEITVVISDLTSPNQPEMVLRIPVGQ